MLGPAPRNLIEDLRRIEILLPLALPFHGVGVAVTGQSQKARRLHRAKRMHQRFYPSLDQRFFRQVPVGCHLRI
jgi:hypothetical protein